MVVLPLLFGLDMMKKMGYYVNEVTDEFIKNKNQNQRLQLKFKLGHLYLECSPKLIVYTRSHFLEIHKRFAHPTADKFSTFLKRAKPEEYSSSVRTILKYIVSKSKSCQRMAPKLYTFEVSLLGDKKFNHEVIIDLTWIEPRPHRLAVHIVDRGTHFSAARF